MRRLFLAASSVLVPAAAGANGLLDCYHLAQQQDQTFQAALHQRDASIEARPQAWSTLLPQVTGQGDVERDRLHVLSSTQSGNSSLNGNGGTGTPTPAANRAIEWYTTRGYSLNLSQTVFDWSAFQTVAQSDQQVAQAEATYRSAEQSLITRTASAYFAVLSAQDTLRADLDAQASFQQQLEQAQKKFEVGLAAITDVRNAQASYDTSSATVIADRTTLDNAKRALGVIVGQPVDSIANLQEDIPLVAPNPTAPDDWTKASSHDNPDLMSSFYAAESARKLVAVYRGKYLPTLAAGGTLNRQDSHSQFGDDTLADTVGLTLTWNIFQGGLVTSQVRQATATYQQAQAQYELQRRTVDQNTRNDFEGVVSGIAGVKANKQAVVSNQTSLEATQVGLKVGTRTEIDVLNARQALAAAQKSYYQSRYTYLNSVLALKQDAGRVNESDLAEIDRLMEGGASAAPAPAPAAAEPAAR
ncbi:MAG: TolC family outer membrane protein [Nevskia sp.]|nr:TolC family outer membrane protein [Nevskia sp.]